MRAVDTNVLVRLIVRDDPEQVDRAEAFVAQGAWVSLLVLAEAVWVPTFRGIVLGVVSAVALAVPLSAGAGHDMHRPAVTGRGDTFDPAQLPPTCANRIGEHFLCADYGFDHDELLQANAHAVPLFSNDRQASCGRSPALSSSPGSSARGSG